LWSRPGQGTAAVARFQQKRTVGHIAPCIRWLTGEPPMQASEIVVEDLRGRIPDLEGILCVGCRTGMGFSLVGARRLMDRFDIDMAPGRGSVLRMAKRLQRHAAALRSAAAT
jgi:hypothetical protein